MNDDRKHNQIHKGKAGEVEANKPKHAIMNLDEEQTIKSERIRYKNADDIYE